MFGKKDCAKVYAEKFGVSKAEAERQIEKVVDVITDAIVEGGGVQFLGKFSIKAVQRKARMGRNPANGDPYEIPAKTALKIKIGTDLDDRLNS